MLAHSNEGPLVISKSMVSKSVNSIFTANLQNLINQHFRGPVGKGSSTNMQYVGIFENSFVSIYMPPYVKSWPEIVRNI